LFCKKFEELDNFEDFYNNKIFSRKHISRKFEYLYDFSENANVQMLAKNFARTDM